MNIGTVIRTYRKEKNMTQEEMANRLGVTAPAVNKWEKGNSYPDITLLVPIARLLNISLDTLLSFQEELTEEEITQIIMEADQRLKTESYEEVFQWAKQKIETYPNSLMLIWQLAVILDAQRMFQGISDEGEYESYILDCYQRVAESDDEKLRTLAGDSLFGYYLRKEQYDEAEQCLTYFSAQNPERKRKQATIYSKTNRRQEAYKTFEELMFQELQTLSMAISHLSCLAIEDENYKKAHKLADIQSGLERLFERGKYYETSCKLDVATAEKDTDMLLDIMEEMLENVDTISGFCDSDLFEHMEFRKADSDFQKEMKQNLIRCFQDEETYGFLAGNERWERIREGSVAVTV